MTPEPQTRPVASNMVLRAQKGEESSLQALYEQYHPGIYRYLVYQVNDSHTAEDLTGDVFVRMLQSLPAFRPHLGTFQAWLYRIAHNLAVDHLRKSNNHHMHILDEDHPDDAADPVEAVSQALSSEALRQAFNQLNEAQREVVILRFILGMPIEEVAQVLGRSQDAIKGLQRRGLAALRTLLLGMEVKNDEA